jgi:hypothetical protein
MNEYYCKYTAEQIESITQKPSSIVKSTDNTLDVKTRRAIMIALVASMLIVLGGFMASGIRPVSSLTEKEKVERSYNDLPDDAKEHFQKFYDSVHNK